MRRPAAGEAGGHLGVASSKRLWIRGRAQPLGFSVLLLTLTLLLGSHGDFTSTAGRGTKTSMDSGQK